MQFVFRGIYSVCHFILILCPASQWKSLTECIPKAHRAGYCYCRGKNTQYGSAGISESEYIFLHGAPERIQDVLLDVNNTVWLVEKQLPLDHFIMNPMIILVQLPGSLTVLSSLLFIPVKEQTLAGETAIYRRRKGNRGTMKVIKLPGNSKSGGLWLDCWNCHRLYIIVVVRCMTRENKSTQLK